MTPEELEQFLEEQKRKKATPPSTPSRPAAPKTPYPPPKRDLPTAVSTKRAESAETRALMDLRREEDRLRREIRQQLMDEGQISVVTTDFEEEVERRLQAQRKPPYIGGFTGPVVPYSVEGEYDFSIVPPASPQPINLPTPELSVVDVLRPQTRVPELVAEQTIADPFDDVAFEKQIKELSDEDKRQKRAAYKGFKSAYTKLRQLNPNVPTDELLKDLDRQLGSLDDVLSGKGPTIDQDPAQQLGIATGDPVARALSRQTESGKVPKLEPGQLAFLEGYYQSELPLQQAADRERLSKKGAKPVMEKRTRPSGERGPGGRPIMEEYQVQVGTTDYTQEEINQIIADKTKKGEYDARPWWANEAERQKILADPEKYAKGGFLFQKEYKTGAIVESPVSWTLRSAMLIPNTIAGAVGYALTPESTQRAKEEDRPEKFRETGLGANVLYNVATSGGYTKELGDAFKYNPDPSIREYETAARVVGFGLDLLGTGDIAPVAGAVGGTKAAVQFGRAAAAVGESATSAAAKAGARAFASEFLGTLPYGGKLATKLSPGDVRLIYGAKLADEFQAGSRYKAVFDEAVSAGSSVDDAHRAASSSVKTDFPKTKLADDVDKVGPELRTRIDDTRPKSSYFAKGHGEFKASDEVANAAANLERGIEDPKYDRLVRPYLSSAAKSDPKIARAIADAFANVPKNTRVRAAEIYAKLDDAGKASLTKAIKTAASFDQGVKVMDTQLAGAFDRGAPTVALTPRTYTSPKEVDKIVGAYKETPFFKNAVEPLQKGTVETIGEGTRAVQAYVVPSEDVADILRQAATAARTGGLITAADEARILKNLEFTSDAGRAIAVDDLRLLSYSEVDAISGAMRGGITKAGLAEVGVTRAPKGSGRAVAARQERRLGELQSQLPVVIKRTKDSLMGSVDSIGTEITAVQKDLVAAAKSKVSALDRVLRDDLQRLKTDSDFARQYGTTTDASDTEHLIALGQGVVNGTGRRIGSRTYAEQLLEGLIYGTSQNKLVNAFKPEYRYGASVLGSSTEYNRLVDEVADLSPSDLEAFLPELFTRLRSIVKTNINTAITDIGGRVLAVPEQLTIESLAVAYARVKANEIIAETATKLLPERPIALGADGQFVISLGGRKKLGDKIFYTMVREQVQNPNFIDDLATGAIDIEQFITRLVDDVAGADATINKPVLKAALRTAVNPSAGAVRGYILDDVLEQIDIMRDYGMLESNKMEDFMDRLGQLVSGKISPNNLVLPAVAEELQKMIGSEAKYKQAVTELARLSDLAADGSRSAIGASKALRWMIDSYNSFYYYAMLSLSPRFHGVNNISAPAITYYTTGRVANPFRTPEAANVLLLGSPVSRVRSAIGANKIVVTDRLGNAYTRGQLYELAMKNGIFKSQINTEVAGDFIAEANNIMGRTSLLDKAYKPFTLPKQFLGDPLAAFTDNVWRMESVIASIRNGSTIDEALTVGRKSLFDYGDLTDTERFISRNFFVFYNYFRQSVVTGMQNFLSNPGRMVRLYRATTQPSRIMIGEENYQDLAYYFPQDAATARIVATLEPASTAKEGKFVQYPVMPHADALKIAAGVLADPIGFAIGPAPISEAGRREYTEGFIAARLGPLTKAAGGLLFNDTPITNMLEMRMKKNRIAPEHVAAWDALLTDGGRDSILSYFGAKVEDAPPNRGENAYNGKIYVLDDEGFARYQKWLTLAQTTGTIRSWNDWSKIVGGAELTGAYPETTWQRIQSAAGLKTYSAASLEYVSSERYLKDRARVISIERGELKKERLK